MIRYFHKFKKNEVVQKPIFDYTVVFEVRYKDNHFRLASLFECETEPLKERKKAMVVYGETRKVIEFLAKNGFFDDEPMEFTADVYSRIGNDQIRILGAGIDEDAPNLSLEFETLKLYGFIPDGEPTMTLISPDGIETTILMSDIAY